MTDLILSKEEKYFITSGIADNFRNDGRSCSDYRSVTVEIGVVTSASGSAKIRVAGTHVLVGIKAELAEPDPTAPTTGRLEFFVDCSANATPIFEGRGGDKLANQLADALSRTFCRGTLNGSALCAIPGKACWNLWVDALVLEVGGNLLDALSIAVKCALFDTKIPKLRLIGEGEELDFEVSDDPEDALRLDVSNVPLLITLNKIGDNFLVDASAEEECCCDGQLLVSVNEAGCICSTQQQGGGRINPELCCDMIDVARAVGMELNQKLMKTLQRSEDTHDDVKLGFKS